MKGILSLLVLMSALSAQASSISVKAINQLIQKNHAGWVARDNVISNMSDVEIKRLLGSTDMPAGNGLFEDRNLAATSLDWRNIDGTNWVGPILDQGNCGSCVAFAAVAALEARYRISSGFAWLKPTFSPQQLFNCGGGACDYGWQPSGAASYLKTKGIVDLACSPYESGSTGEDVQCKANFCQNQIERTYKIAGSTMPSIFGGSAAKVKAALAQGPLVTTLTVYEDFMVYSSGIYKSVSTKSVGGHAVSIVGYNDQERYWIVRNSWGADWGENGFIRVSYDDKSGIGDSTWAYQINPEDNYISVQSPKDHDYVSGEGSMQVSMAKPDVSEIILSGESDHLNVAICQDRSVESCRVSLDSLALKDGRYEIYAKSGTKKSQVREFFVVNHEPTTSITFSGADGVDFSKPQSGRIEFNIDIKASPVVPQRVTFTVQDQSGKVVAKRVTDQVVEQMRLGFRTTTIANGTYIISYKAETPFNGQMSTVFSNKETLIVKN